ncbi:Uncharacterized protein APZ42_030283 [Daphnia magna]|uniref:Uncharacterized protein n=1 Tax=Daphnia magna TaxID=35525 RepID=A0A0P4Z106_9CRUS|nr:Uncharacterized protein APZ42_030283 [Daphnia magna]
MINNISTFLVLTGKCSSTFCCKIAVPTIFQVFALHRLNTLINFSSCYCLPYKIKHENFSPHLRFVIVPLAAHIRPVATSSFFQFLLRCRLVFAPFSLRRRFVFASSSPRARCLVRSSRYRYILNV